VSFIKSRLRRVEAKSRSLLQCSECGFRPAAPGRIVFSDQGKGFPDNPDEQCPGCSRRLWIVIEVVEGEGVTPIG
jgi:hypothetical protein